MNLVLCGLGAAAGALLAYGNYRISRHFVREKPNQVALSFMIRQMINILFLLVLFLIAKKTGLSLAALLLGGAFGLTVPSVGFTVLLNRELGRRPEKEDTNG